MLFILVVPHLCSLHAGSCSLWSPCSLPGHGGCCLWSSSTRTPCKCRISHVSIQSKFMVKIPPHLWNVNLVELKTQAVQYESSWRRGGAGACLCTVALGVASGDAVGIRTSYWITGSMDEFIWELGASLKVRILIWFTCLDHMCTTNFLETRKYSQEYSQEWALWLFRITFHGF